MKKIDSHQHFWQYDPLKHSWMSDEMQAIKKDFLPNDLKPLLAGNDLDGCVAVQADQSEAETHFLNELAIQNAFIKGVVGWVDLRAENIRERLEFFSQFEKVKGFRHVVQDEPDPEFMLQGSFLHGIEQLSSFNFTYDILIFPNQLPAAISLTKKFPNQPFVLDHIAKPYIQKGLIDEWKRDVQKLSEAENTYCKVSGMVTEADWKKWTYDDFVPYLDVVMEAFGTHRIMYGSDWPVCLVSCGYTKMKSIVDEYFSQLSATEIAQIMGENAIKFYNLKD
ncbi:MAG: amidohydrolase family protein [Bacteroidota bacterium]